MAMWRSIAVALCAFALATAVHAQSGRRGGDEGSRVKRAVSEIQKQISAGEYVRAEQQAQHLLERLRERGADESGAAANVLMLLGRSLHQQGRYEEALVPGAEGVGMCQRLRGEDGWLTMREVIEQVRLDAELIVLSACNTAGGAGGGEGFAGLTRAFMYAGARGLVVSHWAVESAATRDLMVEMFRRLRAGADASVALAEAQRTVRASSVQSAGRPLSRAHPFFWAPFVFVGD